MEVVTNREFEAWRAWWDIEWNTPNRTDHYIMNLTRVAAQSTKDLNVFKLPFSRVQVKKQQQMTRAQQSSYAKSVWMARMEMAKKKR